MKAKTVALCRIQGPVVRKLDSAIQRIAIFSSFLKQLVNWSEPN